MQGRYQAFLWVVGMQQVLKASWVGRRVVLTGFTALALFATGCATVYQVSPKPTAGQALVNQDGGQAALQSVKNNEVTVALKRMHGQFEDIRLQVTFTNKTDKPVYFASEMVGATLQGVPMRALSYEAQVFDIQNRLAYYGQRIGYVENGHLPFNPTYAPGGMLKVDANDMLDIVRARADYAHLQQFGLKPGWVQPGATVSGEVVLPQRLPAGQQIGLSVSVSVAGEQHAFDFGYRS